MSKDEKKPLLNRIGFGLIFVVMMAIFILLLYTAGEEPTTFRTIPTQYIAALGGPGERSGNSTFMMSPTWPAAPRDTLP